MAKNFKYKELQNIFVELTALLRNIDLNNEEQSSLIRLAYQKTSTPFQNIYDGVCYLWVNYAESDNNNQINEEYIEKDSTKDEIILKRSQTRQIDVHWIFYGDENVQDLAYAFRNSIFSYKAKHFLDKYDIKLIPDVPEVVFLFEDINNMWWGRTELIVSYYLEYALDESLDRLTAVNVYAEFNAEDDKVIKKDIYIAKEGE